MLIGTIGALAALNLFGPSIRGLMPNNLPLFDPEGQESGFGLFRTLTLTITDYDTSQETDIPAFYDNYANVWDTITQEDQPMLFFVTRTGVRTLRKILGSCLGMCLASNLAATDPSGEGLLPADALEIKTHSVTGDSYLNVDLSTSEGIAKGVSTDLVPSRLADVMITQRLYESAAMFTPSYKGRLFIILRNPIKRVVDQFYYRQRATWEDDYDEELAAMTLDEFSRSDKMVENYIVRSLLNKGDGDLTASHVQTAKHILRRKFIVGLVEWYSLGVVRFEKYFGWWEKYQVVTNTTVNFCHYSKITDDIPTGYNPKSELGSESWKVIGVRNWADIELYFYAKDLFYQQAKLV